MMNWLRKHNRKSLSSPFRRFCLAGLYSRLFGFQQTPFSAVLVVNGRKVPYKRFDVLLQRRTREQEGALTDEAMAALKSAVIQDLVRETALLQESAATA